MAFSFFSHKRKSSTEDRNRYTDYINLAYKRFQDFFGISQYQYADAVVASILDPFFVAFKNTEWMPLSGNDSLTFAKFKIFFKQHADDVFFLLYKDGYANVYDDGEVFRVSNSEYSLKPMYVFVHPDYKHFGKSSETLLKPFLIYLDNILNSANTSIRRLGVMAFLMPKTDAYGNGLTEKELKEAEERLQREYGVLADQRVIKITSHDYSLATLNIGGANLQFDSRLQSVIKIVSGKIGVPYELVSAAIIGNPNQTGVYQSEAMKRLYVTVRRYCEMFVNFAESLGILAKYDNINAPKDYEMDDATLEAQVLTNVHEAETYGYLTHDEAKEIYLTKIGKQ